MHLDAAGLRQAARSGWVPAVGVLVFAGAALMLSGVGLGSVVRFAAYCGLGLVLPGLVMWRLLVPRYAGSLVSDAVFGTSLAYAVELIVYVLCAHAGAPGVAFVWPVVPLAVSVLPRFRALVWRRGARQPLWWTWSVSALVVVAVGGMLRIADAATPLSGLGERTPYVDLPYHLSLVAALSKHAPTDLPFLEGQPLYYHWFFHAHVAAAGHATGIELLELLTRFCLVPILVVIVLGAALLTQRLSGSALAGLGASALLVVANTAPVAPALSRALDPSVASLSPTTIYAQALLVGCIAISVHLLAQSGEQTRTHWSEWACAVALLAVISGAKSTMLPIVAAGYLAVLVLRPFTRRPLPRAVLGLFGASVVIELLAQHFIYGGSSQGTSLRAMRIGGYIAQDLLMVKSADDASTSLVLVIAVVFLVGTLALGVGAIGHFTRDRWRDPRAQFLVGGAVAGVLGTLAFDNEARNQLYFVRVTPLLLAVAGAWGLAILARRPPRRTATLAAGSFFVTGFVFAFVLERLTPSSLTAGRTHPPSELVVLSQTLLLLAAVALVAVTITVLARSRPSLRGVAPLVCATLVLGMGTAASAEPALRLLVTPREENHVARDIGALPTIGVGGITAARWLRDHSDPDALVATNSHCRIPDKLPCDHRTTWVAAFTERQVLIEGWSYTSVTNAEGKKQGHTTPYVRYWKPRVLAANDRVFRRPTEAAVTRLHQRYGVDWLFVDEREGADLTGMEKVADLRYRKGEYAVFRIG